MGNNLNTKLWENFLLISLPMSRSLYEEGNINIRT